VRKPKQEKYAYEARVALWPSRDPIGEWGGLNLYQYVYNNPVKWVDPLGLDVFFNQKTERIFHQWVKICGDTPTHDKGAKDSNGFWPGSGVPGTVQNPDTYGDGRTKKPYDSKRITSTPEDEAALRKWIEDNHDHNDSSSSRNPNYGYLTNNCRDWVDKVKDKLKDIIKERIKREKKAAGKP